MAYLIAVCGALATFFIALAISRKMRDAVAEIHSHGREIAVSERWQVHAELLMADFNKNPTRAKLAEQMDNELLKAARPARLTGVQYLALLQIGTISASVMILVLGLLGGFGIFGTAITAVLAGATVWWLARRQLKAWVTDRQRAVSREFPYFLDLAVLMMGAGASFSEVLDAYLKISGHSQLALDIRALSGEVRMGTSTDQALGIFESRIPAPDVVTVIRSIRQGIRMGTPLSITLKEQAEAIRFRRSQRAERDAEELKVKLQGPTMLLMIAILLLVLGPALVSMNAGGI